MAPRSKSFDDKRTALAYTAGDRVHPLASLSGICATLRQPALVCTVIREVAQFFQNVRHNKRRDASKYPPLGGPTQTYAICPGGIQVVPSR